MDAILEQGEVIKNNFSKLSGLLVEEEYQEVSIEEGEVIMSSNSLVQDYSIS